MSYEAHDRMIKAFQEYFKAKMKFDKENSDKAGIEARYWLSEIRNEASDLRVEIQKERKERKKARAGTNGRPRKDGLIRNEN